MRAQAAPVDDHATTVHCAYALGSENERHGCDPPATLPSATQRSSGLTDTAVKRDERLVCLRNGHVDVIQLDDSVESVDTDGLHERQEKPGSPTKGYPLSGLLLLALFVLVLDTHRVGRVVVQVVLVTVRIADVQKLAHHRVLGLGLEFWRRLVPLPRLHPEMPVGVDQHPTGASLSFGSAA